MRNVLNHQFAKLLRHEIDERHGGHHQHQDSSGFSIVEAADRPEENQADAAGANQARSTLRNLDRQAFAERSLLLRLLLLPTSRPSAGARRAPAPTSTPASWRV
jgi:hypothetical protein